MIAWSITVRYWPLTDHAWMWYVRVHGMSTKLRSDCLTSWFLTVRLHARIGLCPDHTNRTHGAVALLRIWEGLKKEKLQVCPCFTHRQPVSTVVTKAFSCLIGIAFEFSVFRFWISSFHSVMVKVTAATSPASLRAFKIMARSDSLSPFSCCFCLLRYSFGSVLWLSQPWVW